MNNLNYWTGNSSDSARHEFTYYAESSLQALRINQWNVRFFVRDGDCGTTTKLDIPYLFNIRQDPYESYESAPRAPVTQRKTYLFNPALERLAHHMRTLQKYPPKQRPASLSILEMMQEITESGPASR